MEEHFLVGVSVWETRGPRHMKRGFDGVECDLILIHKVSPRPMGKHCSMEEPSDTLALIRHRPIRDGWHEAAAKSGVSLSSIDYMASLAPLLVGQPVRSSIILPSCG
jgi:hypothetical protein